MEISANVFCDCRGRSGQKADDKKIGVLNTLRTSALFISSNTFDVSLLVIGRSIPKISNLVSLISLANLALYNLIERF